jgi:hypothetical protein
VNPRDTSTQHFLVEWYQPTLAAAPLQETAARLESGAATATAGGTMVRLELTLAAPSDEMLFSVFSADCAAAVLQACQDAGCPPDRVTTGIRTHLSTVARPLECAEVVAVSGAEIEATGVQSRSDP